MKLDEIGRWSEVKLEIVKRYAQEYSKIMAAQKKKKGTYATRLSHSYVDAFAGAGKHISKTTGQFVLGSPLNALNVEPPFDSYYFIDLEKEKSAALAETAKHRSDVFVYLGDCNALLLDEIFPKIKWENFKRGLCLLDPYGLHLKWSVMAQAGKMGSVEIFLNFPVADMNRNVFWRNPEGVNPADIDRMNDFWGDDSWKEVVYSRNLFSEEEKTSDNLTIARAFKDRLKKIAGFKYVPEPVPMKNDQGAVVYYLFFASQKPAAEKIVRYIFEYYGGPEYQWR